MTAHTQSTVVLTAIIATSLALTLALPSVASAFSYFSPNRSVDAWSHTGEISISGSHFQANTSSFADAWANDSVSADHGGYYRNTEAYSSASQSIHVSGNHASVYSSGVSAGAFISTY